MSKCPKCSEKLSPFYLKQTCPKCGVNLMYYEMDKRLEQDAANAQREVEWWTKLRDNIYSVTFGSAISIIRFVVMLIPIISMLLPVFDISNVGNQQFLQKFSLINFLVRLFSRPENEEIGDFLTNFVVDEKLVMMSAILVVFVILFSLITIITSLFSFSKKGFGVNFIFGVLTLVGTLTLSGLVLSGGGKLLLGAFIAVIAEILTLILNFILKRKISK